VSRVPELIVEGPAERCGCEQQGANDGRDPHGGWKGGSRRNAETEARECDHGGHDPGPSGSKPKAPSE
jgi:hypothetical protein